MPITPYLSGQPFDPETIHDMSLAFKGVCKALGLRPKDDAITRQVAKKIINLRQRGVSGDELRNRTITEIKPSHTVRPAGRRAHATDDRP